MVGKPDKPLRRYYVSMTWDGWPEGGSYGTVVKATSFDEAEALCREEMASTQASENEPPDEGSDEDDLSDPQWWLDNYGGEWHVIDCILVSDLIKTLSEEDAQ